MLPALQPQAAKPAAQNLLRTTEGGEESQWLRSFKKRIEEAG